MRVPRELAIIVVLLAAIAVATYWVQPTPAGQQQPDLSSHSADPEGALALYLWLQALGYQVERLEYRDFRVDDNTGVILMLAPSIGAANIEVDMLKAWVQRGGTLIVSAEAQERRASSFRFFRRSEPAASGVLRAFGIELRRAAQPLGEATAPRPSTASNALQKATVASSSFVTGKAAVLPHLGRSTEPVAAELPFGKGKVYVLASASTWSNARLREADNAALLLNWLPAPAEARKVVFDEFHHGLAAQKSLLGLMLREPWGWAIFYAIAAAFVWLACRGRRFGRSVPLVSDKRRPAAEYVVSLAGLLRRGDKRDWAAQHYLRALRRQLADSFAIDTRLSPDVVAQRLSELGPAAKGLDPAALERLLRQLSKVGLSEQQLVSLAREVDTAIKVCQGR